MRKATVFKTLKATIAEPSTAIIGKALTLMVPDIGQVSIIAADDETAVAVFNKLLEEKNSSVGVNLAAIQDVALFESAALTPK